MVNAGTINDWFGTPLTNTTVAVDQQYTIDRQLYWDASNGNGPAGGSGTWGSGMDDWHVGSLTGPLQGWVDGSQAFFAGAPGVVEISNPVTVAAMTFLSDAYVIEGSPINLAPTSVTLSPSDASSTIDVTVGVATIECQIAGVAMTKTGDGMLALDAANAYASTIVSAGLLQVQSALALPAGTPLLVKGGIT